MPLVQEYKERVRAEGIHRRIRKSRSREKWRHRPIPRIRPSHSSSSFSSSFDTESTDIDIGTADAVMDELKLVPKLLPAPTKSFKNDPLNVNATGRLNVGIQVGQSFRGASWPHHLRLHCNPSADRESHDPKLSCVSKTWRCCARRTDRRVLPQ